MTTKVYVSGPMTGIAGHNFPAFHAAAAKLRRMGYEVVNPAELDNEGKPWAECLANDIKHLVDCQVIAMLPGWEGSKGAQLERYIGVALSMTVRGIGDFHEQS